MSERKKLSDILREGDRKSIAAAWDTTEAAGEIGPLPSGDYQATIISGELFNAKSGTAGFKLTFEVLYGDYKGRKFWHDVWLTPAALPLAKRDLVKIGVRELGQLERPLPAQFRCKVKLGRRRNDDGTEYNRVLSFECVGVEKVDPFAPPTENTEGGGAAVDDDENDGRGDAYEPPISNGHGGELFPFGANSPAKNGVYGGGERL
jgi:hypothetical protein